MKQGIQQVVEGALGREIPAFNPQDGEQGSEVLNAADELLREFPHGEFAPGSDGIGAIESDKSVPLLTQLTIKLARSKAAVRTLEDPLHVSIVFAMYKEHTRLLRPDEHPHGEDFLIRKINQLRWLFDESTVTWNLIAVDDGCPEESGRLAQRILGERAPEEPVTVLFLEEAIEGRLGVTRPMTSVADSQKGGSVVYGMWKAANDRPEDHIVVFTDADLSVDLGQTGLLIDGIIRKEKDAAIASRRQPESAVVKMGHRNTRGKLFIFLWKGLLGPLRYITDTQCGFKAFKAETLRDIIEEIGEKRFAFDLELLLKTELRRKDSITKIPIAWIDSEAASTTTDLEPYLPMLRSAVAMYRRYLPDDPKANSIAGLIESLRDSDWAYLSENVPASIADADPTRFGLPDLSTVESLVSVMRQS